MNDKNKIINRLTISRHDLDQCLRFLDQLPAHEYGSTIYEALLLAAIIFYARPFSCNEKDKNAKATAKVEKKVLNGLTIEELDLHNKLITLRNKAIAHSEWNYHPTGLTKRGIISSVPFSIWDHFPGSGYIQDFSKLVNKVLLNAHHLTADMVLERL